MGITGQVPVNCLFSVMLYEKRNNFWTFVSKSYKHEYKIWIIIFLYVFYLFIFLVGTICVGQDALWGCACRIQRS